MPVFEYRALDENGKTVTGILDADSSFSAREKLRTRKVFPVSVNEVEKTALKRSTRVFSIPALFTRVNPSETALHTRQLSTLVSAGFPLVSALDALISQTGTQFFQKKLAKIKDSVVEGSSFAQALSQHPDTFPPFFVNMVEAGETSGTLEIVLERLADMTEKHQELKQRIRSALAYPILMLIIGILVLFFLLTYIVPGITAIFEEMNHVLPASTRFLIFVSEIFINWWWVMILAMAGAGLAIHYYKRTKRGRCLIHRALLRIPVVGKLVTKLSVARFSRTLGSLLENGVPMLAALDIVKNIVGNVIISDIVQKAASEVGKGKGLGQALGEAKIFPNLSIQMIQIGEQSGELEKMLIKVADVFEKEVESTIVGFTSLLEPLMIVFMGTIVGFIVLSICLPIFEMNQLVK